ncbi:DUF5011 domain-containing protein [Bifidobacterium callitrichidarum]|nr:DUF5011 domain-containing protein [Bifidobacterium callitrichidarum]
MAAWMYLPDGQILKVPLGPPALLEQYKCQTRITFKYANTTYKASASYTAFPYGSQGVAGQVYVHILDNSGKEIKKRMVGSNCWVAEYAVGDFSTDQFYRCSDYTTTPTDPQTTKTATLKFDLQDGTGDFKPLTATGKTGSHTFQLDGTVPSKAHWSFLGWNQDDAATDASVNKDGKVSVPYGSTVTLYAVWRNNYPVINGAQDTTIPVGSLFDSTAGVTATDPEDGDVLPSLQVTGTVDTSKQGTYELTYTVQDAVGYKTTVKRVITVRQMLSSMPSTGETNPLMLVSLGIGLLGLTIPVRRRLV